MRFQSRAVGGARARGQMRSSKKCNFMRSSKRGKCWSKKTWRTWVIVGSYSRRWKREELEVELEEQQHLEEELKDWEDQPRLHTWPRQVVLTVRSPFKEGGLVVAWGCQKHHGQLTFQNSWAGTALRTYYIQASEPQFVEYCSNMSTNTDFSKAVAVLLHVIICAARHNASFPNYQFHNWLLASLRFSD